MRIRDEDDDLDEQKEIKVKIPKRQHIRLHSLRVLSGTGISEAVTEALEMYFEEETELGDTADFAYEEGNP